MIADCDTNVVFVADTLEPRFPAVFHGLKSILTEHGIPLKTIPGTREIWCKDYLPVQVTEDRFIQFRYAPDYLTGKYRHLRTDGEIGPGLLWVKNCVRSEIVLDGGNVVKWTDKVIMTEKVLNQNAEWRRRQLLAELEQLLEVDRVILIPVEPGDVIGHADGVLRFVDGDTVLVNNYRQVDRAYRETLLRRLRRSGLRIAECPYQPWTGRSKGVPPATGNYVNFLRSRGIVVLPTYGVPQDQDAMRVVKKCFPAASVFGLDCRQLALEGGVLNCATWDA